MSIPQGPQLESKGIAVAVADGISSSAVSQIASESAVKVFLQDYYCTSDSWSVKTSCLRVLKAINSWLYAQTRSSQYRFNKDKGYICTFSAMVFKSNTAHVFHCGDSRIYRFHESHLEQLTNDHRHTISEEESYLIRALGIYNTLEVDYQALNISVGDVFVLATDGVYEYLNDKHFSEKDLAHAQELDSIAEHLVNEAYQAGSKDNLTLQLIRIEELPDSQIDELGQQVNALPPPPPLCARMEFEGLNILRELYISSRSHVFLACNPKTQQHLVIKTPSAENRENPAFLENLLMEEWIARRINNNHVLRAYERHYNRQHLYTAFEFVEGQTLSQWMLDHPKPDIESVRNIVEQIAKGLQAFHRQEMVHQDLRPHNIMLDQSGTVKIIDFGSTKVAGISEISRRNEGIVGTVQYSAPEYFLGHEGTARSDLFSLGVITYQLLSGRLPYGNDVSKANSLRELNRLRYAPLAHQDIAVPQWVDYAIAKATHINPLKRYNEVSEFIYELRHPSRQFLSKQNPPWIERNPVLFWQCVSIFLFAIVIALLVLG